MTSTSATLLDHIYSNSSLLGQADVFDFGMADHGAIYCQFNKNICHVGQKDNRCHRYAISRQVKKVSDTAICDALQSKDWSMVMITENINEAFATFMNIYTSAWDDVAPLRQRQTRVRPNPWMTDELLKPLHHRKLAYKQFLHNRSVANVLHYKQLRNVFKTQVRKAKRQCFAEGAKSGGKFFWSNVKLASEIGRLKKNLPWRAATKTAACRSAESLNDFLIYSVNEIAANLPKPSTSVSA